MTTEPNAVQRIVVGVDGSSHARRALRWALDEARVRGAAVEVVHVWHAPYFGAYPFPSAAYDLGDAEPAARQLLDEEVDAADTTGLVRAVERTLVYGNAAHGILEAAKGADLIVVGNRGLGGFTELLLGSVSHQVAHHAPCPVVIVPTTEAED